MKISSSKTKSESKKVKNTTLFYTQLTNELNSKMDKDKICQTLGLDPLETEAISVSGFPIVRNKFYTGFADYGGVNEISKKIKKGIEMRQEKYQKLIESEDYIGVIFLVERPFRFSEFFDLREEIESVKGKEYAAKLCGHIWIDSENPGINAQIWRMWFEHYGEYMMDEEDLKVWNELPESFEVWRGEEGEHDMEVSWTLSKKVAQFFANRFTQDPRKILKKTVNKSDCLCYFGGRN